MSYEFDTVGNTANNYLAICAKMANKLMATLINAMDQVAPIGVIMKVILGFLTVVMAYHLITAILRGIQEGHPKGLLGEILDTLWGHMPRVMAFTLLALAATGVTNASSWGTADVKVAGSSPLVQSVDGLAKTFQTVLGNERGSTTGKWSPTASLKAGTQQAIKAIDGLNLLDVKNKIDAKVQEMIELGKAKSQQAGSPTPAGTESSGTIATALRKLIKDAVVPFFEFGVMASQLAAQYVLAKNLVANYIYILLAWRMALHFLPIIILLAYWRSLQGFLLNGFKHLLALSIAGVIMGEMSKVLFSGQFWLGKPTSPVPIVGASPYLITAEGSGILDKALKNTYITGADEWASVGTYPWLKSIATPYMILVQFGALFALIGVILGEMFSLVRGAMDGAMRSHYGASIASTTGR